jgi:mono/diheme cytochrome c family protein
MDSLRTAVRRSHGPTAPRAFGIWLVVGLSVLSVAAVGCFNNNTGRTEIGGKISFTLPAFPESGPHAVEVFTEMHYQPSYRSQELPRLLPPSDSVPVTGREVVPESIDDFADQPVPDRATAPYDSQKAQALFEVNCAVCHASDLKGDGPIVEFIDKGPLPADLTAGLTVDSTDGELFGFISEGGRQGQAAYRRDRPSASPMPFFRSLMTEEDRWALVLYIRSEIGR